MPPTPAPTPAPKITFWSLPRLLRRRGPGSWILKTLLVLILLAAAGLTYGFLHFSAIALQYDLEEVRKMPQRAIVYDMDGQPFNRLYGENRLIVNVAQVSDNFKLALIAREDTRFYDHHGVDPWGIARAIFRNLKDGDIQQGASTITQQLARNTFPLGGRNLQRKLVEALLASRIEARYSKDEILQHYMNRIYFGSGYYGIQSAALGYFGKNASDLTLPEGALLAGLIRSPNRLSPRRNPQAALAERNSVLSRMESVGLITPSQRTAAADSPVTLGAPDPTLSTENYAMDYIRRELGLVLDTQHTIEGGLSIQTTIDSHLQRLAEQVLEQELSNIEKQKGYHHARKADFTPPDPDPDNSANPGPDASQTPYVQGAVVIIENSTGAVRAFVGGRDYDDSKYNRALLSRRQIGSSFKPFVYSTAFQSGTLPHTPISDDRLHPGEIEGAGSWDPDNSDGKYLGLQPADFGLYKSRNTMSIRVGARAGLENVRRVATLAGLARDTDIPQFPVICLGAFESTLRDLTAAYTIFPNRGYRPKEHIIQSVLDGTGSPVGMKFPDTKVKVLEPYAAWLTTLVLQQTFTKGTAAGADNEWNGVAAGKTGTTNNFHDAWFIGYTRSLTCGVWVGMDQPQPIMDSGYGSKLALPIWTGIMKSADPARYPAGDFAAGEQGVPCPLCGDSGLRATDACLRSGTAITYTFPAGVEPPAGVCPLPHLGPSASSRPAAFLPPPPRPNDRNNNDFWAPIRRLFGGQ